MLAKVTSFDGRVQNLGANGRAAAHHVEIRIRKWLRAMQFDLRVINFVWRGRHDDIKSLADFEPLQIAFAGGEFKPCRRPRIP